MFINKVFIDGFQAVIAVLITRGFYIDKYVDSLEDCRISELCPTGVITTPGRQKGRTEPLLTVFTLDIYSQFRLISLRLIEHSRIVIDFLGTGRPHSK